MGLRPQSPRTPARPGVFFVLGRDLGSAASQPSGENQRETFSAIPQGPDDTLPTVRTLLHHVLKRS